MYSESTLAARRRQPAAAPARRGHRTPNISQTEKIISTVGGSALALAGLSRGRLGGLLLTALGGALVYRGVTGYCHAYEVLGIDTARHNPATAVPARQGVKVDLAVVINRPAHELYAFWRKLENLPHVMRRLEHVEVMAGGRSRWTAKGPMGKVVTWEAEIVSDRAPELISWRSLEGGDIDTAGSVQFKSLDHGRGTAVSVSLKYNPPAGKLGDAVAALLGGNLEMELSQDLRRFKSAMETGEIPTTAGQPRGLSQ